MVPRAGELSAILLNHLFGREWVGALWSFGWSCGFACGRLLSSNPLMALNVPIVSSGTKCSFLSSSHPFIYLFSCSLSFPQSFSFTFPLLLLFIHPLVHFSTLPLFHSSTPTLPFLPPILALPHSLTLPTSHSPTSPLSHSSTLPFSQSPTLPHSHPLTPPFFHSSTCPAFHSSTGPLVPSSSSSETQPMYICRGGKLPKEFGMKSSQSIAPLVVYNPVRQDGICCSSLEWFPLQFCGFQNVKCFLWEDLSFMLVILPNIYMKILHSHCEKHSLYEPGCQHVVVSVWVSVLYLTA